MIPFAFPVELFSLTAHVGDGRGSGVREFTLSTEERSNGAVRGGSKNTQITNNEDGLGGCFTSPEMMDVLAGID